METSSQGCIHQQRTADSQRGSKAIWNVECPCFLATLTVWGWRAQVRMALDMGTIVAARFNPVIRCFYQRLCAAGKAKKFALVACTRKMLVILNAMLKHRTPWQPHEAPHA